VNRIIRAYSLFTSKSVGIGTEADGLCLAWRFLITALEMPLKRRHGAALQILAVATTSQDATLHMALPRWKPKFHALFKRHS